MQARPGSLILELASMANGAFTVVNETENNALLKHADDLSWSALATLSHVQAATAEEAMVQLAWAMSLSDAAHNSVAPNKEVEALDYRQLQRLLFSAYRFFERAHGIDLQAAGYEHLDPTGHDPFNRRKDAMEIAA